jgi:hypothetical protein
MFDRLAQRCESSGFRGCPFVNAMAELGESCHAARAIAVRFKDGRRAWFRDRLAQCGVAEPDLLATQLSLLMDGAAAAMVVRADSSVADAAREAARVLLAAAGVAA